VQVTLAEPLGAEVIAHFPLGAVDETGPRVTARLSPRSGAQSGKPLRVAIDLERLYFFDLESQEAIS
jgi:ABC-type sugar transport system ATPase subunit